MAKISANNRLNEAKVEDQLAEFESLFTNPGWMSWLPLSTDDIEKLEIHTVPSSQENPVGKYVDRFSAMVLSTQRKLTISTLWFVEGNLIEAELKKGIKHLNAKVSVNNPITVRILIGQANTGFSGEVAGLKQKLHWLLEGVVLNPGFTLGLFSYDGMMPSKHWNHSKIVAVDNDKILAGGINFVTNDYTQAENPVHDVSLYLEKESIAEFGHRFITQELSSDNKKIMGAVVTHDKPSAEVYFGQYHKIPALLNRINDAFKTDVAFNNTASVLAEESYIVGVGKGSNAKNIHQYNTSKKAMLMLINTAKQYVYIAQRSISTFLKRDHHASLREWEPIGIEFCQAIGEAIARGVKVDIVLGGYSAVEGYSSSVPKHELIDKILEVSSATEKHLSHLSVNSAKNRFDSIGSLNVGSIPLHSKIIMADYDKVYLGSHNAYWNGHVEFSFIIKSKLFFSKLTKEFCEGINPTTPTCLLEQWNGDYSDSLVNSLADYSKVLIADLNKIVIQHNLPKLERLLSQRHKEQANQSIGYLEDIVHSLKELMNHWLDQVSGLVDFIPPQTLRESGKTRFTLEVNIPGNISSYGVNVLSEGRSKDITALKSQILEGDIARLEKEILDAFKKMSIVLRAPIIKTLKPHLQADKAMYKQIKRLETKEIESIELFSGSISKRIFEACHHAFEAYLQRHC